MFVILGFNWEGAEEILIWLYHKMVYLRRNGEDGRWWVGVIFFESDDVVPNDMEDECT